MLSVWAATHNKSNGCIKYLKHVLILKWVMNKYMGSYVQLHHSSIMWNGINLLAHKVTLPGIRNEEHHVNLKFRVPAVDPRDSQDRTVWYLWHKSGLLTLAALFLPGGCKSLFCCLSSGGFELNATDLPFFPWKPILACGVQAQSIKI